MSALCTTEASKVSIYDLERSCFFDDAAAGQEPSMPWSPPVKPLLQGMDSISCMMLK